MKYSEGFKKEDPMHGLPEKVTTRILEKTELLAGALADRSDYLKEMLTEMGEGAEEPDSNSVALVERLAFYECMIESLVCKVDDLEQRIGGKARRN
jgi:hypothetical protein